MIHEELIVDSNDCGEVLLSTVAGFIRRFVVVGQEALTALTLWVAHTYCWDAADATPYIHTFSTEKRSGKTRLLEVLALLVSNPWMTSRVTPSTLVRQLDKLKPTLLLDESDAALRIRSEYSDTLRGILDGGHRRGGKVSLSVQSGKDWAPKDFRVFGPKAIAGIGRLPDTIADRSIRIELRRRRPNEGVDRFRVREVQPLADSLRSVSRTWAAQHLATLMEARPLLPEFLDDRAADAWEPLFAIADAAGGPWPTKALVAAHQLSARRSETDDSNGIRLLLDIKSVFEENHKAQIIFSEDLCNLLCLDEEKVWGDVHGQRLDARKLAQMLREFGIRPRQVRISEVTKKGYHRSDFVETWERYLQ
jgi:hypothetical protein